MLEQIKNQFNLANTRFITHHRFGINLIEIGPQQYIEGHHLLEEAQKFFSEKDPHSTVVTLQMMSTKSIICPKTAVI